MFGLANMGRGQGGNGGGPGNIDFTKEIREWWTKLPLFTRTIFLSLCGTYILSWIFEEYVIYLLDIPYSTIYKLYSTSSFLLFDHPSPTVWSLFTAPFVSYQLMNLIFGILTYFIWFAPSFERANGTVTHAVFFIFFNLYTHIVFNLLGFLVGMLVKDVLLFPCYGVWTAYMVFLTIRCFSDPEGERRFFCFPCPIKNKFYPFLLILIFSLLSGFPLIDLIAACAIGAIFTLKPSVADVLLPTVSTLKKIEESFACSCFTRFESFVPISGSEQSATNRVLNDQQGGSQISTSSSQPQAAQPRTFSGRGVSIGQGALPNNPISNYGRGTQAEPQYNPAIDTDPHNLDIEARVKEGPKKETRGKDDDYGIVDDLEEPSIDEATNASQEERN